MELQGVDPGTGNKNKHVKDKNQQNYQGRAFISYIIKKKKKENLKTLVSSELCKIVNCFR